MFNEKLSLLKSLGNEIKIGIIISDIIMTIYVLWLICTNQSSWIPGAIFGYTPFGVWLLYRANKLYSLCLIHKLMMFHTFAIFICCMIQAYVGFGDYLYIMRWMMFITGMLLIIKLSYAIKRNNGSIFRAICQRFEK